MLLLLVKNDSLRVVELLLFWAKRSGIIIPCLRARLFLIVDSVAWLPPLFLCTHGTDAYYLSVWIRYLATINYRIRLIIRIMRPLHLVHVGFQDVEPLIIDISLHTDNPLIFCGSIECSDRTLLNSWCLRTTDDSLSLPPESKSILVN